MKYRPTILFAAVAGLAWAGSVVAVRSGESAATCKMAVSAGKKPAVDTVSADEALKRLKQGNRRCVEGKSVHKHDLAKWRSRYRTGQKPFATVLSCSDSRVPPELLYDAGFGDLFVIRIAGNIVDSDVIGSIQYAIERLDNKLIVVMGHQNCGAVTAALAPLKAAEREPAELQKLLDRIRPAIRSVDRRLKCEQRLSAAIEANARVSVKRLRKVPSIAKAIKTKGVQVIGVVYGIDSGKLRIVGD